MNNHDRTELIAFLATIARPGMNPGQFDDDADLVREGIIDSLALVQIIQFLEQRGVNPWELGLDPAELSSVNGILQVLTKGQSSQV